jgi:hypothetical protein
VSPDFHLLREWWKDSKCDFRRWQFQAHWQEVVVVDFQMSQLLLTQLYWKNPQLWALEVSLASSFQLRLAFQCCPRWRSAVAVFEVEIRHEQESSSALDLTDEGCQQLDSPPYYLAGEE